MTKLEQSARKSFETWWEHEGQEFLFALNTTTDDDIKLVAEIAWKNGAYCAEQAEQEPVGYFAYDEERQCWDQVIGKDSDGAVAFYTAPQPISQEPVVDLSKLRHEDKCCYWGDESFCNCGADSHELLKWYRKNAAPVRTKDLTDDEIRKLWSDAELDITWFARAVIAADREKNK